VIGGGVSVFRPAGRPTFRRAGSPRFLYAGASAAWDPPPAVTESMRSAARRVGEHIRDSLDYRGAFNLDGVLTEDGWRPTELNARFAAGLGTLQRGFNASLFHLHLTVVEGEDLDYRPQELETTFLAAVAENRESAFGAPIDGYSIGEQAEADLVWEEGTFRRARDDEGAVGTVQIGPMASGSYLRYSQSDSKLGPSFAPTAAAVLAFADREWGIGVGELEVPPNPS